MTRTGHSLIRAEMKAQAAPLGGELSGHIFVGERWYGFDDAFYAAARLIEVLMAETEPVSRVFARLPTAHATPELRIPLPSGEAEAILAKVLARAGELGGEAVTIDGLRVNYPDGWGLVRSSTTSAGLVLRFEGDTPEALARIERCFREFLVDIEPTLELPT
jgi:phosphomannomutase